MNSSPVSFKDIQAARKRISKVLIDTPVTHSHYFSHKLGRCVYLKWDNRQVTGSFKERGALNFLELLSKSDRKKGVCTASAGNHALGLSHHSQQLDISCTVVMPKVAPLVKIQRAKETGANVILHGTTLDQARDFAIEFAQNESLIYVHGFDDRAVIAGQGTCGIEILEQVKDFDSVVVPVGGGGLISGIAIAVKELKPNVKVIGVYSEWVSLAKEYLNLIAQGQEPGPLPISIADGIAVKTLGKLNQEIVERYVDEVVTVSEAQIASAIIALLKVEHTVVEGAGAAALAATIEGLLPGGCKKPVVLVSGSNIDLNLLSSIITSDMVLQGQMVRILASVPDRPGSLESITSVIAECGANVLHVHHDRMSTRLGLVDILFVIEVHDRDHTNHVLKALAADNIEAILFDSPK